MFSSLNNHLCHMTQKRKKRSFIEMINQPKLKEDLQNVEPFRIEKRKKLDSETNNSMPVYRDVECMNELQSDLSNLRLKTTKIVNKEIEINSVDDIDIPEITNIPVEGNKAENERIQCGYEVDDDAETNNTTLNFDLEAPYVTHEGKMTGKIIDNAIKSEKTLMKFFDNMNPNLQPNNNNGIILYSDMKKMKKKVDNGMLVNYIVSLYKEDKGQTMDIFDTLNFNSEEEIEFDIVNNNYDFYNNDMFLD